MYKRDISEFIKKVSAKYPVVTLIGPRQSGKSTLTRLLFPDHAYVSLETPDHRAMAQEDPRGFFKNFPPPLILDEVQRVPDLLSYIQTFVDEPGFKKKFVLTGSQQILLMEKITQSLAGRTVIAKLLPFSLAELQAGPDSKQIREIDPLLFTGGYPRIYDKKLSPPEWLESYYQTYVERDVRTLVKVDQLDLFDRFVRLCAGRAAQLVNFSSLAADCGISPPTARSWLTVLQTSFICFALQPHFKNFNKRIIKSPKLYFYDTGLLCYLLKIREADHLANHSLRGFIFENWVVSELAKNSYNRGQEPSLYFWRDTNGHEVDIVVDQGTDLYPIEVKASYTFNRENFLKNLIFFRALQKGKKEPPKGGHCLYAGDSSFSAEPFEIVSWKEIGKLLF